MLHKKFNTWLQSGPQNFPRRLLLSGDDAFDQALELTSILQKTSKEKITSGIHADAIVFRDLGKSFKIDYSDAAQKDGQSEHENARGLVKWLHRTPEQGCYRIAILENLERLSRESPHALLKLIEEPPKDAFLIFTTQNHHQILETVLSRVTVVRLPSTEKTNSQPLTTAKDFMEAKNVIERFQIIDELDKQSKELKDKNLFSLFTREIIEILRTHQGLHGKLPEAFETFLAIKRNQNPKFCLEYFALELESQNL